ncbi:MAG: DUF1467 family protein [Alphaproteobacteria bacterium]
MNWFSGLVFFVIVWWVVLFTVLPIGVRSQQEADGVSWGTEPGAPARSRILVKFAVTTGLTALIWASVFVALDQGVLSLETFDFMPGPPTPVSVTEGPAGS